MPRAIVLFDGDCALCNGTTRWIAARDRHARFRFVSLQSEEGAALAHDAGSPALDTVVLVDGARVWTRSGAAIEIAKRLNFPWSLMVAALVVPGPLRDALYDVVARNRHRWRERRRNPSQSNGSSN